MKKIARVFLFLALPIALTGCNRRADDDRVVAKVGAEKLTITDLVDDIPQQIQKNLTSAEVREFVLQWINNEVLYQEALNRHLDEREDLKRQFEKLRKELLVNKLIQQTLGNDITVSDEEVQAYYDNNKESFALEEDMVKAYHALFKTSKEANAFRQKLAQGTPFAEAIQQTFGDSLNADDWDWGYFDRQDVIPEIADVLFKLRVGSYSRPIRSKYGYHIVQLLDKLKKGDVKKFETVKEEIRLKLETRKKQEMYQRFLLQAKSKYQIETNFQFLNSSTLDSLLHKKGARLN